MRMVFPEGAGHVRQPEDLGPLGRIGPVEEAGANMLRIAIATLEAYLRGEQPHVVDA